MGAALAAEGLDARRLRWVYGPNSTASGGCGSAAGYYPGHGYVDYLGMSAYRSGTQSVNAAVLAPAHALTTALGYPAAWASDRFIVLQAGTRDVPGDDRGAWVTGLYGALTADPLFLGAIYFDQGTWALLDATATPLAGYPQWTAALAALPTASPRLDGTFEPFFWDVRIEHPYYAELQSLRAAGLTSGCGSAPPTFCPDDALTRVAAAILAARAFAVASDASGPALFGDVAAGDPGYGEIQALAKQGAFAGCGATTFCPGQPIDRRAGGAPASGRLRWGSVLPVGAGDARGGGCVDRAERGCGAGAAAVTTPDRDAPDCRDCAASAPCGDA